MVSLTVSLNWWEVLTWYRTCPVVQPILYGYDAIAETEEAWAKAEEKPLSNLSPKI